ncbi:MAG: iron-sulfur cluster-binding protein, partial [Nocardioidaceae bacterium]
AARAAEQHGAWSQVAVPWPTACGTGLCHGCAVPVVAEHGVAQLVRACTEGPVLRGDRVRWDALIGDRG